MLVFTNAFALAEAAASRPMANPRIGYQSWLRDLEAADVTVSSEDQDFPRDMPLIPTTAQAWKPTALPATWVVDMGTGRDVDYVGIAGHTIGSSGCAVLVETSDGSVAGSPVEQVWTTVAEDIAPGDDAPLLFLDTSRTCRYVRITITGGSTMPRIASIYAGEILAMQRSIYGGISPMNLARDTELTQTLSRGGEFLGQGFKSHGQSTSVPFRYLTADWYRTYFDPFVKAARRYPFFFAWRPEDFDTEVAYCWATSAMKPQNMGMKDLDRKSVV